MGYFGAEVPNVCMYVFRLIIVWYYFTITVYNHILKGAYCSISVDYLRSSLCPKQVVRIMSLADSTLASI